MNLKHSEKLQEALSMATKSYVEALVSPCWSDTSLDVYEYRAKELLGRRGVKESYTA